MIITLKGANFSANNIGTLSTWAISKVLGDGATYNGATYVDKGTALNATVTISEGYELNGSVIVTMGGNTVTSGVTVNGNTITIAIASVTGNVVIKVPTKVIGDQTTYYTVTYKYTDASNGSFIQADTTEQVAAGTNMTFSTSNAPFIKDYFVASVSPTSAVINQDTTVTYTYTNAASGGGDEGETTDTNLMPLDARLDENTIFASDTSSQQWGAWKGTAPVVENDYVKVHCDLTNSLQGIRKAAPDNVKSGDTVNISFYAKIGADQTLEKNLQFYLAGSKNTVFTGLSTEWKLCEWTVTFDDTWTSDRMQISMNTAQTTPITLYLKDFSLTIVE